MDTIKQVFFCCNLQSFLGSHKKCLPFLMLEIAEISSYGHKIEFFLRFSDKNTYF